MAWVLSAGLSGCKAAEFVSLSECKALIVVQEMKRAVKERKWS